MKHTHKSRFSTTMMAAVVLLMAACSGAGLKEADLPPLDAEAEARFAATTPAEAVAALEKRMEAVEEVRLGDYAPAHMGRARQALEGARRALDDGKARVVFEWVVVAEKALDDAETTRKEVEQRLSGFFEMKAALIRARADRYRLHRFRKLMDRGSELIAMVEAGRAEEVKKRLPPLLADMTAFETDTIVHYALDPAAQALEEARQVEAAELAPHSYDKARLTYQRAEREIRANPHASEHVGRIADEALREARHAFFVARRVAQLEAMKRDHLEQIVLEEERRLGRVARALELGPIHDRSLDDQARTLVTTARQLKNRFDALAQRPGPRLPTPVMETLTRDQTTQEAFVDLPEEELLAPVTPHSHNMAEE